MLTNDLVNFMASESNRLAEEYERIQKRVGEDPGTAGDQGEENWATLLRYWLPPTYYVTTKGRIMGHDGRTSPQVDVIVLSAAYPTALRNTKTYLAGGVVAAFECKITLRASHIEKALKTATEISDLFYPREGAPHEELHSPIIYGLLGHSHSFGEDSAAAAELLEQKLLRSDESIVEHPRQMLELVCVSDLGTWLACRILMSSSPHEPGVDSEPGQILTSYFGYTREQSPGDVKFSPVGALLTGLYRKIAREDTALERLSEYVVDSGIRGSARAPKGRQWSLDIFSESLRPRIKDSLESSDRRWMYMYE
jgi:hypothetical protein